MSYFVGTLAKSPTFAKDPRRLQFETDINRLFLYTSYNRVGKDAEEADIEEIINMASKSDLADQEKQVQENIHSQITNFCTFMDHMLLPESKSDDETSQQHTTAPRRSGLSLAIGRNVPPNTQVGKFLSLKSRAVHEPSQGKLWLGSIINRAGLARPGFETELKIYARARLGLAWWLDCKKKCNT
ncbi:putative SET domain-containing protein [Helianthus annuus]|nr:putative SET domain-containing protein [Helianthus annuus]